MNKDLIKQEQLHLQTIFQKNEQILFLIQENEKMKELLDTVGQEAGIPEVEDKAV